MRVSELLNALAYINQIKSVLYSFPKKRKGRRSRSRKGKSYRIKMNTIIVRKHRPATQHDTIQNDTQQDEISDLLYCSIYNDIDV